MRYLFFIFVFVFLAVGSFAQGKTVLLGDNKGLERLVKDHISFNESVKGFPGYRIQIFFESGNYSKNKAFGEKSKFLSKYPEHSAYVVFQEPYYKVRVGNFRNKLEAEAFKYRIKDQWSESYIIKDDIELPLVLPLKASK